MKKLKIILFISFFCTMLVYAQSSYQTEKVIFVVLDGFRWQELFYGADSSLYFSDQYVQDRQLIDNRFWHQQYAQRRRLLLPFIWSVGMQQGSIYGNRNYNNFVNVTNSFWFSYPGYNEIFTGITNDKEINSNDKINNPNKTVLEMVNNDPRYKEKVAVFGSWDLFPYIVNQSRNGIYVNAGYTDAKGVLTDREIFLNELQDFLISPWSSVRPDILTHYYAFEYLKKNKPSLFYIIYDETDDLAHDGRYDLYLRAANNIDSYIKQLYEWVQTEPEYAGKTTFIITADHGRGYDKDEWRNHGKSIAHSDETWFVIISPDLKPNGEMKTKGQYFNCQFAPTVAKLLDVKYHQKKEHGQPFDFIK